MKETLNKTRIIKRFNKIKNNRNKANNNKFNNNSIYRNLPQNNKKF
jgi:hypothetical protein